MTISQFSRACSRYGIIVTSYINGWYLFWYQWKEDVHTYTGIKFRVIWPSVLIIRRGLQKTPSENMCGKTLRRTRVKTMSFQMSQGGYQVIAILPIKSKMIAAKKQCFFAIFVLNWFFTFVIRSPRFTNAYKFGVSVNTSVVDIPT